MPSEQMQAFIDALRDHIPQDGSLTVEQHRAMHDALLARRPPDEDVRIEETTLGGVAAEWVWAEGVPAARVVLHCHGGGFRAGSPRGSRQFAGRLSRASKARIAVLDYRLAPEYPFPAALDDVIASYRALLDAGHAAASIAFGGESIGGGTLALAALTAVRESGLPLPASVFALSPLTDLTLNSPAISGAGGRDPLARRRPPVRGSGARLPSAGPGSSGTAGVAALRGLVRAASGAHRGRQHRAADRRCATADRAGAAGRSARNP